MAAILHTKFNFHLHLSETIFNVVEMLFKVAQEGYII